MESVFHIFTFTFNILILGRAGVSKNKTGLQLVSKPVEQDVGFFQRTLEGL